MIKVNMETKALRHLALILLLKASAISSQGTHLEEVTKKLLFDTGEVIWGLDEESQTFIFTSLPDNCTLSIRLQPHDYEEFVQNITNNQLDQEDFFYIRVVENTNIVQPYSITGFAAVNQAERSHFQFLPFRVEDMPSIFQLTAPPVIREAQYYKTLDIYMPFPSGCEDLERATNKEIPLRDLEDSTANILITVLLLAITYNPYLHLPHLFEICSLDTEYSDIPFALVTCCAVKEKLIFEASSRHEVVRCSDPDRARQYLALFATVLGFICFLFVPLLVKYLPATPEEWQKIKTKCMQKCNERRTNIMDETKEDIER